MTAIRGSDYTPTEDALIAKHYSCATDLQDLVELLPGRELGSIRARAVKLGYRRRRIGSIRSDVRVGLASIFSPDDAHVMAVMAEGGFPASYVIDGKTVWIRPTERRAA